MVDHEVSQNWLENIFTPKLDELIEIGLIFSYLIRIFYITWYKVIGKLCFH